MTLLRRLAPHTGFHLFVPGGWSKGRDKGILALLRKWDSTYRDRQKLRALPRERLEDLGLTEADVDRECSRPFWRS